MGKKRTSKHRISMHLRQWQLYLLCLPAFVYLVIFKYIPMYGLQIAFKEYSFKKGIIGSEFIGFDNFIKFISNPLFWSLIRNTLSISLYSLILFPIPIILALLIHNVTNRNFKKFIQAVTYAPHFISIVVLCGMIRLFLNPSFGIINTILAGLGLSKSNYMAIPSAFPHIYVWSDVWANSGWSCIIYLAALSSVNISLYDAAKIDGATKFDIIRKIELPSISPTIVIMFLTKVGNIMTVGYQKAFLLQTSANTASSEIISTYVYRRGLINADYSYGTAIDLFNVVINLFILLFVNKLCRKMTGTSLW